MTASESPGRVAPRHAAPGVGGLVFDVPDVLYDSTLWRRWLLRLIHQLGVTAVYADFYHAWERGYLVDVCRGRREYQEAFQSFLLAAGLTWAQVDEVEAASRIQRHNLELKVRPLPGVLQAIAELRALGLPLVAWADECQGAVELGQRLARLGLAGSFACVLSSFDLECTQPEPASYQSVLDALGLEACDTVYVGHDAEHLAGARSRGLRTVAFNFEPGAPADFYLTRFEDLPALVKCWSSSMPAGWPPENETGSELSAILGHEKGLPRDACSSFSTGHEVLDARRDPALLANPGGCP